MRKFLLAIIIVIFVSLNAANAYDLNRMTDNSEIVSALEVLENNRQNDVLDRLTKNNVKVIFYDLALVSFEYSKHFAVSTTDEYGDRYILINSNLMSSPKEALACLIAHESVHELAKQQWKKKLRQQMLKLIHGRC